MISKIQRFLLGVVANGSVYSDPLTFQLDGSGSSVVVDYSKSPVPEGFAEGRTIAVRRNIILLQWILGFGIV